MALKTNKWGPLYEVIDGDGLERCCALCDKGADPHNADHACRVCGKVYHKECCKKSGKVTNFDFDIMDRAFSQIGWSCVDCDGIGMSTLTPDELMEISDVFEKYDSNNDDCITLAEYLDARKHLLGRELSDREKEEEEDQFKRLDRDKSGTIDRKEFTAHEAIRYIDKHDKEDLVKKLTPLEKLSAKRLFMLLDKNKDGEIDRWESVSRFGLLGWYQLINRLEEVKLTDSDASGHPMSIPKGGRRKSSVVGQHIVPSSLRVLKYDENKDGKVNWPEFLRGHAKDIIKARPNKSE